MPSDTSWDFGPVLDLIDSDSTLVDSPAHRPHPKAHDGIVDSTLTLGSFAKLWESLGIKIEEPPAATTADTQFAKDAPSTLSKYTTQSVPNVDEPARHDAKTSKFSDQPGDFSSDDPIVSSIARLPGKNARKKARRTQRLEQRLQEEQAKLDKQREALKDQFAQSGYNPKPPQLDAGKEISRFNARSRSNVGAKVRPITPPEAHDSAPVQPSFTTPAQSGLFDPTSAALQSRLAKELESASASRITDTDIQKQSNLSNYEPRPSHSTFNSQPTHSDVQSRSQLGTFPAGNSVGRPGHITPSTNPVLANINAGLQTQYTTGGTPFTYITPLSGGYRSPLNGYSMTENIPTSRPVHPMHHGLVPSSVQHVPRTERSTRGPVVPTREDRNIEFLQRLMSRFPEDKRWLGALMPYKPSDKLSPSAIHVFIDASNILIGFNQTRSMAGLPPCDMSFDGLAFLLERRRPVAKRIYSGSTRCSAPIPSNEKFNTLAGDVGYEKNIFEQVYKSKELTERQRFFRDVDRLGYSKAYQMRRSGGSGGSSDSETGASPSKAHTSLAPKWVEQGVDESLHLKMCQSIIDCDIPSTMVLATGDGAEAEYSDGFLSHVERALKNGWIVELVSWRQQTNSGYKSKKFRAKWGDKFRVIELDEFMEFLVDV